MGRITLFIIVVLSFCQCVSDKKDDEWCKKMNQKSTDYIFNFQMSGDSVFLDSALYCTNEALKNCSEFNMLLSFRKLGILSIKRDFPQAISFINTFEGPMVIELPYYNNYLLNRFKAMNYQWEGDTLRRNIALKTIIVDIDGFVSQNKKGIDSLFNLKDIQDILKNPLHFAPVQYYYIKSILCGNKNVQTELDSLQKVKGGNSEYFEFISESLNNDFMYFVGY